MSIQKDLLNQSENDSDLTLELLISGRMLNIHLCDNSTLHEFEEVEELKEYDNAIHYENSVANFFKIDSDNIITINLNDKTVFSGTVADLGISPESTIQREDYNEVQNEKFNNFINDLSNNNLLNSLYLEINEDDEEELLIDLTPNNIFINTASIDRIKCKIVDDWKKRYSMVEYGKFVIKTPPLKVKSFELSDLVFVRDINMDDFENSSDDTPYCFSLIIHPDHGELEWTISDSNIKDSWHHRGWICDF